MDRSNVTSNYKDTVLRQSFVFNTGGTNNLQRSFINTALVNDSMAYGDDLRKYLDLLILGHEYKICPTIKKLILARIFSLLLSSRLLKSNVFPIKLKCSESGLKSTKDSFSMPRTTKFKSDSSLKNASPWKGKGNSTERKWKS